MNDIISTLQHSHVLLYADDVKIFSIVHSVHECSLLQANFNSLAVWCDDNGLDLNIKKCNAISFLKGNSRILYDYSFHNLKLNRAEVVKDFGVLFDSAVTFAPHLNFVVSKSFKILGFIKRTNKDFHNISAIIHLYKSLLIPNLIYCSQIWSPFTNTLGSKLESINHKFLRYVAFKANRPISPFDHNYTEIVTLYNIQTINSLHYYHDCLLTFKIIHNAIHCPELNSLFRDRLLTYSPRNHNFGFYSSINCMKRLWNLLPTSLTSVQNLSRFKPALRSLTINY